MRSNYNFFEKKFHSLVLNNFFLNEILEDIENKLYLSKHKLDCDNNFFVSGLARSGTTYLLECLYKQEIFGSLVYRDMPMISCVNLWNFITKKFKTETVSKIRLHGDGIKIDYDSPEALDEIKWKSILKNSYYKKNSLLKHDINNNNLIRYKSMIKAVLIKTKKKFYLSKNNNNILRLNSLLNYFPNSIFIFVIRDPSSHVISLQNMHKKFKELQKNDPFILNYMNYLGHHEFGSGHKVFDFSNSQDDIKKDDENINYWLNIWINYYEYLEKYLINNNIYLLDYSKFCNNQNKYIEFFVKKKIENYNIKNFIKKTDSKKNYGKLDDSLLNKANILYEKLITDYSV